MRSAAACVPILLVLAALLGPLSAPAGAQVADWTLLIYMDADNDLEDIGILDFLEIASVGSTANVNVLVQFDRIPGTDSSHGDWTDARRFRVTQRLFPVPGAELMDLGEVDMSDPATLVDFVRWGVENYSARHYFLDLWDHGLGWMGVVKDQTSGGAYMTTADLGFALAQIHGILGRPIDLVGTDACRMTVEMMYELRPHADYLIGSEKDVPADGWPYGDLLSALVASPTMTPLQVGASLARVYVASYKDTGSYSVTLSLVAAAALPAVAAALRDFTAELNASVPLLQAEVAAARLATERYEPAVGGDEYDLYHFAQNAARIGHPRLARAAAALEAAIEAAVLVNEVWDHPNPQNGIHARFAHGLSIWFPDTPTEPSYPALALSADTDWDGFLAAYRSGTPSPLSTGAVARSVDRDGDGLAEGIEVVATPLLNGSLFVDVTAGPRLVTSRSLPAFGNRTEVLNVTGLPAGRYNVTVAYYVGGELRDLDTTPGLPVQGRVNFTGTVRDGSGRDLAGATVSLTNLNTSESVTVTASASGYMIQVVVPDFFEPGDTLRIAASASGRTASATFVAGEGTAQTANLVVDLTGAADPNSVLLGLAVAGLAISVFLAIVALWQRREIARLRRRP